MTSTSARLPRSDELLRLDGISVRLSGREILKDVSFAVRPGEFTGLIGPNGAGKTTILRVILGLQPPSSGTVTVAGSEPGQRPGRRRRGPVVGYVPQKLLIEPDMPLRVRDVVALGIDGNRLGVPLPSRARRDLVAETLRAVGADGYADARVGELANLDIRSAQGIVAILARLAHEQRIAILISAHDMNPLAQVMDRIVYVAAGRAAVGSSEEVLRTDVLSNLYGQHVDVLHVHGRVVIVAGEDDEDTGGPGGLDRRPDTVYGSGAA